MLDLQKNRILNGGYRMNWFKWHLLNWGLFLKRIFGLLKKNAVSDVLSIANGKEEIIQNKGAFGFEMHVADRYYEFWDLDYSSLQRMNIYAIIVFSILIINAVKVIFGISYIYDNYIYYAGRVAVIICLILFLYENLKKKSVDIPVTEIEYNNSKEWLLYMGEKNRRLMPLWLWVVTFLGVFIEAAAIVMIIISWFADTTKTFEFYGGIIIGVAAAIAIAAIVHHAGAALYREHHRKNIWTNIEQNKDEAKGKEIYNNLTKLNPQISYEEKPFFRTYGIIILAISMIMLLSVFTFISRANLNEGIIRNQSKSQVINNDFFDTVPPDVSKQQNLAYLDSVKDAENTQIKSMYAALGALMIIFLIINIFGAMNGYKYSFYSDYSEESFNSVQRYEKQLYLKGVDDEYSLSVHGAIEKKANQLFSIYKPLLMGAIRSERIRDSLKDALNIRGEYRMEYYLSNIKNK
jgi:hypothetical protein